MMLGKRKAYVKLNPFVLIDNNGLWKQTDWVRFLYFSE